MNGWIKLHRSLLEWEWFKEPDTLAVFIFLLLSARCNDGAWKGYSIKRGEVITGRKAISQATGISERSVRTALNRLKTTGEITIRTTNRFSVVSTVKWDIYQRGPENDDQQNDQQGDQLPTSKRPATDHDVIREEGGEGQDRKNKSRKPRKPTAKQQLAAATALGEVARSKRNVP